METNKITRGVETTKRKKKKRSLYIYTLGDKHSQSASLRHQKCVENKHVVPSHMGWLWTTKDYKKNKPWKEWKPGVIDKGVSKIISGFKATALERHISSYHMHKSTIQGEKKLRTSIQSSKIPIENPIIERKVNLTIKKHGGIITVTVHPKQNSTTKLESSDNPLSDFDDFVFRIVKNKSSSEKTTHVKNMRNNDKSKREIEICHVLEKVLPHISRSSYADICLDHRQDVNTDIKENHSFNYNECNCEEETDSETSTDESDWEYEDTPTVGLAMERKLHVSDFVHAGTQYTPEDELT